jgi:hypothetical protein
MVLLLAGLGLGGNAVRTRNARPAAIHSLFRYLALHHPEHAAVIERVLALPSKRGAHRLIAFLTEAELEGMAGSACGVGIRFEPGPEPTGVQPETPDPKRAPPSSLCGDGCASSSPGGSTVIMKSVGFWMGLVTTV